MKQSLLLVALLAAVPAFAQNAYVTGQVGRVEHKVGVEGVSLNDTDTGGLLAVGYRINQNVAVEAGYMYLGKFSKSEQGYSIYAKPTSFYGALVGTLAVTPAISVSAKLGVARHSVDVGFDDPWGDSGNQTIHKTKAMFGIGAAYSVTPAVAVVAEYTHLGTLADDQETHESLKGSVLSAGVRFSF